MQKHSWLEVLAVLLTANEHYRLDHCIDRGELLSEVAGEEFAAGAMWQVDELCVTGVLQRFDVHHVNPLGQRVCVEHLPRERGHSKVVLGPPSESTKPRQESMRCRLSSLVRERDQKELPNQGLTYRSNPTITLRATSLSHCQASLTTCSVISQVAAARNAEVD